MALLEQRRGRSLGGWNPTPDPGLVVGRRKRTRMRRRWAARFGIVKEGEVADIFLGRHAMRWWGRVSTKAGLVVGRTSGGRKKDI